MLALGALQVPDSMAESPTSLSFDCDWRLGFNLSPGQKGAVGYLMFWSGCGGLTLAQDIQVGNPYSSPGQQIVKGDKVTCVGLLESFRYDGGPDDPMRFVAYVSKGAAANLRAKLATPLTTTKLKVSWYAVGYDDECKAWYEASLVKDASRKVDAVIDSVDGVLQLFVANTPTRVADHLDIQVFRTEFQIAPQEGKSAVLEFATGPTTRVVKQWGDTG